MKMLKILKEIILDAVRTIKNFLLRNAYFFSKLIEITLPYCMMFLVDNYGIKNLFMIIPICVTILTSTLKEFMNRIGKGIMVPIPNERFTTIDEETGEVFIDRNRLQELIIYINDVENYLSNKGML